VYIILSRVFYENVFLFEQDVPPLTFQKNRREVNLLIRTAILDAVRESIPVSQLLRTYLDETTEIVKEERVQDKEESDRVKVEDKSEEIKMDDPKVEEIKTDDPKVEEIKVEDLKVEDLKVDDLKVEDLKVEDLKVDLKVEDLKVEDLKVDLNVDLKVEDLGKVELPIDKKERRIKFSDVDHAITVDNFRETIPAPKDIPTLQKLSDMRHSQRQAEEGDFSIGEVIDTKLDFEVV
jgi:hypothetical protein